MALPPLQQRSNLNLRPGDTLVVIHDFNARSTDELTLRKSERVELIELDEGFGDGWYLGRHLSRGGTGLFPGVYTTKAPSQAQPSQSQILSRGNYMQAAAQPSIHNTTTTESSTSATTPEVVHQHTSLIAQPTRGYSQSYDSPRTSLPSTYSPFVPGVQRSIGETLGSDQHVEEDSQVMNETLSVIDEHITDLSTPRQSLAPQKTIREDSESEYSSHMDRQSYIAGPETDDEENDTLNEADVRTWGAKKTAQHLRSIGVDSKHCDIFEDQEITGDVLLDMDQGFIYMKEYDFGVMGRRLKTWHKIRDFQDEAKGRKISRQSTFSSVDPSSSTEDMSTRSQGRTTSGSTYLPRIPSLMEKPGLNIRHSTQNTSIQEDAVAPLQSAFSRTSLGANTPPSPWRASMVADNSSRPSAAMVRELAHSRRHSSIDFGKQPNLELSASSAEPTPSLHRKQGSLDRDWSMSGSTAVNPAPSPRRLTTEAKREPLDLATPSQVSTTSTSDLDRGYFSGNEVDNRKNRNLLRKRDGDVGATHTRQASVAAATMKRHSRLASADSIRDKNPSTSLPASRAYQSSGLKGRVRSASARGPSSQSLSGGATPPTVTNLEKEGMLPSHRNTSTTSSNALSSMQTKAKRLIGIRAVSETSSPSEKQSIPQIGTPQDESVRASPIASPTGSTTPSQASRSLDYENSETSTRVGELVGLAALPRASARTRPKAKQETSAYVRGLLKISPAEARKTCDYHGWMKKKSSSLMTTWKPRLFILRGRRLSYYYSEDDTEERGIIDISGHKVLVANSDAMVTLHAQITGATSAASPAGAVNSTPEESMPVVSPLTDVAPPSLFYFKLIPPKSGTSRAVQFTKPAIHYFQVDSVATGRKWMGELMKATIIHDWTTFETTNKQKTISLAKARARGERPSVLLGDGETKEIETIIDPVKESTEEGGLNIKGLDLEGPDTPLTLVDEKEANKENTIIADYGTTPVTEGINTS